MKKFLLYSFTVALFSLAPTMVNAQTTSDGDENTEPTPEVVATPVIDPAGGAVAPGTEITITCATEGATIYYTTDGSTPTNESTPYTTPIVIVDITVVNAIAEKEDCTDSAVASLLFTLEDKDATTVTFDFTNQEFLMNLLGLDEGNELFTTKEGKYPVQNKSYTYEDITMAFSPKGNKGAGANPRFYNNGNIIDFRFYLGQWFSVTNNVEDLYIKEITFTSNVTDPFVMAGGAIDESDYDSSTTFGTMIEAAKQGVWVAPENTTAVKFFNTTDDADKVTTRISTMTIVLKSNMDKIDNISVNGNNSSTPEYYNLQGMRVSNPAAGQLLIKRQGNTVTKVLVK